MRKDNHVCLSSHGTVIPGSWASKTETVTEGCGVGPSMQKSSDTKIKDPKLNHSIEIQSRTQKRKALSWDT